MFRFSSKQLISVGVVLLITGVVLPLLIVIKAIPSTYLLNFLSYACSLVGMVLGFLGLFSEVKIRRDRLKREKNEQNFNRKSAASASASASRARSR